MRFGILKFCARLTRARPLRPARPAFQYSGDRAIAQSLIPKYRSRERKDRPWRRSGLTYAEAGVDIDAGNRMVELIKPLVRATARPGADAEIGGFGGLFDLKRAGYSDPVLVAATDGVGTKVKIAIETGRHETIGIDLVAMSVNDLVVQGAEPLFFLDYFACGELEPDVGAAGRAGRGGRAAARPNCALIGGETAEMPGLYQPGDYDLAGFAVGAAERGTLLPRDDIAAGDVVLGLASSGVHSNGYSLVRKIVRASRSELGRPRPFDSGRDLGAALIEPTRIYVTACLAAIRETKAVKALAHITGGGFPDNIPRVLPKGLGAEIDLGARAGVAGVPMARPRRQCRPGRNAADVQLRHRHDRRGGGERSRRGGGGVHARRRKRGAARHACAEQ